MRNLVLFLASMLLCSCAGKNPAFFVGDLSNDTDSSICFLSSSLELLESEVIEDFAFLGGSSQGPLAMSYDLPGYQYTLLYPGEKVRVVIERDVELLDGKQDVFFPFATCAEVVLRPSTLPTVGYINTSIALGETIVDMRSFNSGPYFKSWRDAGGILAVSLELIDY